MSCDCAELRTELLSQRKLMVEWFESLMTELQDVKSQLTTKFTSFNIGEEESSTAQQLNPNHVVTEPFSASVFLENNHNNLLFHEAGSSKNEVSTPAEPTLNLEANCAKSAVEVSRELIAPKIEPGIEEFPEEFPIELKSSLVDSRSLLQSEQTTSVTAESVGSVDKDGSITQKFSGAYQQPHKKGKFFRRIPKPNIAHQSASTKNHLMAHSRYKPFACDLCSVRCRSMAEMRVHKRIHTGEKPFSCKYCPYRCIKSSDLTRHERLHTGEKPFACDQCDYRSCQKSSLQAHLKTHSGEKPFQCDLCEYRAVARPHINKHKKRCHRPKEMDD